MTRDTRTSVTSASSYMASKYAKDMERLLLGHAHGYPKPQPLTHWQRLRRWPGRVYQSQGERLTRWLMNTFDIYERDY